MMLCKFGPKAVVTLLQRMAGAADIIEHQLIVRHGVISGPVLPERIRTDGHEGGKRECELAKDHAAQ
jgi:hypothetical protein